MSSINFVQFFTLFFFISIPSISAVTLTYNLQPSERVCFHTMASVVNEKMAFYFAVQSGGEFDIDFDVIDPSGGHVLGGQKARQGDYVFAAKYEGEYSFCLSNSMSTVAEKVIDFDISVEHEVKADLSNPSNDLPSPIPKNEEATKKAEKKTEPIHQLLDDIGIELMNVGRMQKYFKLRENRNFATVRSTENRIFWFSVTESLLIIAISIAQVVVIQGFFGKAAGIRV